MKKFRFLYGRNGGWFDLYFNSYAETANECGKSERTCGWFILNNLAVPAREIIMIQEVVDD